MGVRDLLCRRVVRHHKDFLKSAVALARATSSPVDAIDAAMANDVRRQNVWRIALLAFACLTGVLSGCANRNPRLYPTHIEAPAYDGVAQTAHIEGKVVVTATIGAEGNVIDARAVGPPMLVKGAVANLKLWKFQRPHVKQAEQTITYDYRIEGEGDTSCDPGSSLSSRVSFDLPQRVEIVAPPVILCDPAEAVAKRKHR